MFALLSVCKLPQLAVSQNCRHIRADIPISMEKPDDEEDFTVQLSRAKVLDISSLSVLTFYAFLHLAVLYLWSSSKDVLSLECLTSEYGWVYLSQFSRQYI